MRLSFFFLCAAYFFSLSAEPLEIEVSARSAILMNADTGAILFEKEAYKPSYPASTTKLATALFTIDHKKADLDQSILVSSQALQMKPQRPGDYPAHWLELDGTMMGLRTGEILSLETLLHGLMMISGNDAGNAIAESLSGSVPDFVHDMNSYLKDLGCHSTQYLNPHGLHHPEHYTTAYDLALMMKRGLEIPKFREIISKVNYTKPKSNKTPKGEITTFNPLIKPGKHYYSKVIGGKTGYHSNSQATLVVAAEHEGRTLIAVVMGCTKTSRYNDVKNLFEAAFQETKIDHCLISSSQTFTQTIEGATTSLTASLPTDLRISYYPSEEPHCRAFVHWDTFKLPIKKGQTVGEIRIFDEAGQQLKTQALLAKEEVKGTWLFNIKSWLSKIF